MGKRFWSRGRARRFAAALLLSVALAAAARAALDRDQSSLLLRGDFPAFYAAGTLVRQGEAHALYDALRQQQIENIHWPSLDGSYYAYAYPPYVAVLLAPLTALPPIQAKVLVTFLMLLCLWKSVAIGARLRGERCAFELFSLSLAFAPIMAGALGGQNTALSMLLYALILRAYSGTSAQNDAETGPAGDDRRPKQDFLAGALAGLWCFKPHYGLPVVAFLAVSRKPLALVGALIPLAVYGALAWRYFGTTWLLDWINAAQVFSAQDYEANQHQMVSFLGASHALADYLALGSTGHWILTAAAGLLCASVIMLLAIAVLRVRGGEMSLFQALGLLGPAIVLLSPHTLFYDLGIAAVPLYYRLKLATDRNATLGALLLLAVFVVGLAKESFAVQPLFAVAVLAFVLVWRAELAARPFDGEAR